jgi:general stress protein 26
MDKDSAMKIAKEVIDSNDIALVSSISSERYPNTRALKKMKNDDFKVFYFSTRTKSNKVKQMKSHKKGCVYFFNKEKHIGVMLDGKFKIEPNTSVGISDIYKIDPVDPYDFCTIKFIVRNVHVYNNFETIIFKA